MPTFYLYARKSSEDADSQILSIDSQIKELTDFAKQKNLTVQRIFTESKSAKKPGRTVFNEMMKALWKRPVGILCWKLDRLARNPVDGGQLIFSLEESKIAEIITPAQSYRNNTNDKFWMQLEFGMAKKYVDDLSENVKRGLRAKLEHGWFPSLAPLGYLNERHQGQGRRAIVIDPERFPIVRKMWDIMLSGRYSVSKIREMANNEWGLRARTLGSRGSKPLSLSGIYRILTDPFYSGLFRYKGELYEGRHEPMISQEEFDRVQFLLGRKGKRRPKKHLFPFTGLIRCGECGCSITAEEKRKVIKGTGELRRYVYYHCTKKRNPNCTQGSVETKELERQIEEFLGTVSLPERFLQWALKYLDTVREKDQRKSEEVGRNLHREYLAVQKRLDNLISLKISPQNGDGSLLSDEEYASQKSRLLREKAGLAEAVTRSEELKNRVDELTKETLQFTAGLMSRFSNGALEDKRRIFAAVGSNYSLMDGKVVIQAKKIYSIIRDGISRLDGRDTRLEPEIHGSTKRKREAVTSLIPTVCALVDDVRTAIKSHLLEVTSPNVQGLK